MVKTMNPQSATKPVMDISAPRAQAQTIATPPASSSQIPVESAPFNPEPAKPAVPANQEHPTHTQAPSKPLPAKSGAPVGVITVAVLVMMLLSAAAVIVYATSQTA